MRLGWWWSPLCCLRSQGVSQQSSTLPTELLVMMRLFLGYMGRSMDSGLHILGHAHDSHKKMLPSGLGLVVEEVVLV